MRRGGLLGSLQRLLSGTGTASGSNGIARGQVKNLKTPQDNDDVEG
jgi:hypothetical protein